MIIADVFQKDPRQHALLNQGVAKVSDIAEATLRYELDTFVCDGEYARGLERILGAFLSHVGKAEQPGVWVSGFFGSGKSHLVKVLRALWIDHAFADKATARSVVTLPEGIRQQLVELSSVGKRHGGLHAISGLIDQSEQPSMRRAIMSLVFKSKGLPGSWQQAQFCLWLKREGWFDAVMAHITAAGREPVKELANLFVSSVIAQALIKTGCGLGSTESEVRTHLKTQFQTKDDPTNEEIVAAIRAVLGDKQGQIPCTIFVIDEVQQTIGEHDATRSYEFQTLAETLCSSFGGRLLLVATGQSALTGVSNLQRLQGRFPVSVALSDTDVESVIRKTILRKRSDRTADIDTILTRCSGEIDRHLRSTRIEPRPEDKKDLVADYLQEWIDRQTHDAKTGKAGADLRLASAQELRTKLQAIHQGEAPYDIFVRWKPLHEQPLGWNPDLNDGVRLNIRPWITAEVLRVPLKTKIKYGVDRGKDPEGSPWGPERDNDRHFRLAEKQAARAAQTKATRKGT